jgi:hypothetical protein
MEQNAQDPGAEEAAAAGERRGLYRGERVEDIPPP